MADRTIQLQDGKTIEIRELAGREGSDSRTGVSNASVSWLVKGSEDPLICRDALQNAFPSSYNVYDGLYIEELSRERLSDQSWKFTATYNELVPELGGFKLSFDTTGGTVRITSANNQTAFAAVGATAPDFGKALDVDSDGNPQGADIVVPALKLTVRAKIPTDLIEQDYTDVITYVKKISELTGTFNNATWLGFDAGELLFMGGTGEVDAVDPVISFSLLHSQNVTGKTFGDIAGVDKKGHEFIWFWFAPGKDGNNFTVTDQKAAYVSEVYEGADFEELLINQAPPT